MSKLDELIKNKSKAAEAYRTLRTNIQYSSLDDEMKTIVVTSSAPSEGKSTVVSNLAITMAEAGKKVLLVDCDFRKPTIHKRFSLTNKQGLTDILVGNQKVEEVIKLSSINNLYILNCGTIPPNPSELIGSKKMKKYLQDFKEIFDIILIDAPPVLAVTDAQILSTMTDGTILVSAYGRTEKKALVKAKEMITKVNGHLIGVVINMVPSTAQEYHYGGYYEYK